jgi:hypothetical protein
VFPWNLLVLLPVLTMAKGSGSFGTVYKAIDKKTGEVVAIKHVSIWYSDRKRCADPSRLT